MCLTRKPPYAYVSRMEPMHTQNGDLLRLAEAAALLGVHPDTLRRWTDEGKVPCTRTPGGQRRYTREAISCVYVTP